MVKENILNRYGITETGDIIINVSATRVQDLYNDFNKNVPYIRKDLEAELVEYLMDCVREIHSKNFVIHFNLDEPINKESIRRVKQSIRNYFSYLKELGISKIKDMMRRSFLLFVLGLGVLILSLWISRITSSVQNVLIQVLSSGLTVIAWVSLWESLAVFLIQWRPEHKEIKLYDWISEAKISFSKR